MTELSVIRKKISEFTDRPVRIIAVSKTHPPSSIEKLIQEGQRDFGENRYNEARDKFPLVDVSGLSEKQLPIYHHIGPLQSGNARQIPEIFHWVHGASSAKSIRILADAAEKRLQEGKISHRISYLIQLNLTLDPGKTGGMTENEFRNLDQFIENDALQFRGLMSMGPVSQDPSETREIFHRTREIRDEIIPGGELSMGMSGDWETALEEGATMIRLGSILFGQRNSAPWKPGE